MKNNLLIMSREYAENIYILLSLIALFIFIFQFTYF